MVFGALVAGLTSEGGGAVAFPVMTLALGIQPAVARDFSLMIQSCGQSPRLLFSPQRVISLQSVDRRYHIGPAPSLPPQA
jgi:hypothetical protein